MKIITLLACLCLSVWSCDPARRIQMYNQTSGDAEVVWMIKEDSIHSSPLFLSNSKTTVFSLKDDARKISLSCGIGAWNPAAVRNLADDLDSLVIRWGEREIRLASTDSISNYLMSRRRGADNAKIRIVLKD